MNEKLFNAEKLNFWALSSFWIYIHIHVRVQTATTANCVEETRTKSTHM